MFSMRSMRRLGAHALAVFLHGFVYLRGEQVTHRGRIPPHPGPCTLKNRSEAVSLKRRGIKAGIHLADVPQATLQIALRHLTCPWSPTPTPIASYGCRILAAVYTHMMRQVLAAGAAAYTYTRSRGRQR